MTRSPVGTREDTPIRPIDAGVARGLAEQIIRRGDHLRAMAYTATRTQADAYRRVVAAGIAPDRTYEELRDTARSSASAAAGLGLPRPGWWRALAMTVGYQNRYPEDLADAAHLYRVARHLAPTARWRTDETRLYLQILQLTGAVDELESELSAVQELLEDDRLSLEIDLAAARDGLGSPSWNESLDRVLGRWGVRPVRLAADGATPFDRLAAPGPAGTKDGPLITVVMSAFRPGDEILSAVRSITEQTWGNLELLVLDDASGPEYADVLDQVSAVDPRVRVLVQPENRGTYAARNRAVAEARGQFITFQDSDDWSHPERLARQVRPLLDSPSVHSTMSRSVRCTEDLGFQHLAMATSRKNASSLMFPRAVLERLGGFDPVRKSADREFHERLAIALPGEQVLLDDQLAFVRLAAGSLSRGDFRTRWIHPSREEYAQSYQAWHEQITGGASPYLSPDPARRSFRAPRRFIENTGVPVAEPDLDIVLAGDFRTDSDTSGALLDELTALVEQDVRVGIQQLELAGRPDSFPQVLAPEFRRLVEDGSVEHVLTSERAHTALLLIHDPAVLQLPSAEQNLLDADSVAILTHRGGRESVGGALWSASDVTSAVRDLFGVEPVWVPGTAAVRAELAEVQGLLVHGTDAVGPVLPHLWATRRSRATSGRPTVGFASFEGADLWPATQEDFLAAYPVDDTVDVRLYGALDHAWSTVGRPPAQWLVYRAGDLSQRRMLQQLDYVPCFPADSVQRPPADLVRAMAAGAVVIVPERFRAVFGDAAAYTTPDGVLGLVRRLDAHPDERAALTRAAARYVELHHPADQFVTLVLGLLDATARPRGERPLTAVDGPGS